MPEQIPEFTSRAMKEYSESIKVDKFAKNIAIGENYERDDFFQIGIRHLMDNDIFDPKSNVVPYVFGLARSVTLGEVKYFVDNLLKTEDIDIIQHKEEEITPELIFSLIGDWNAAIITSVDIKFNIWLRKNKWYSYIRYPEVGKNAVFSKNYPFSKEYPIFPIPQKLIESIDRKIIIYDRDQIIWKFVEFKNEILDKTDRLNVIINDAPNDKKDELAQ